ncbi:hypothetical protein SAMN05444001_10192 [Parabacteroides chinchillae]|uniref:Uncharacterized protein n=1 Tax=Parabacteroides chinchillae TaxID=871327 RepID=A0A8G2F1G7_9BACT|nr:hypothetical protein SAMN05444001_10192 [Parabacteroides chinchillae]
MIFEKRPDDFTKSSRGFVKGIKIEFSINILSFFIKRQKMLSLTKIN